jgi:hypothetical protein
LSRHQPEIWPACRYHGDVQVLEFVHIFGDLFAKGHHDLGEITLGRLVDPAMIRDIELAAGDVRTEKVRGYASKSFLTVIAEVMVCWFIKKRYQKSDQESLRWRKKSQDLVCFPGQFVQIVHTADGAYA